MNTTTLCDAIKSVIDNQRMNECSFKGHGWVKEFQDELTGRLNSQNPSTGLTWNEEAKTAHRSEGDRIDIYGHSTAEPDWIIEIDATRADQVAKKFVSRLALWGLKDSIEYVAVLYPDSQGGKSECEKFLRYAYDMAHRINSKSNVTGIFINPHDGTVEVLDYRESIHFDVNGHECKSMRDACAKAIALCLDSREVTFDALKTRWGRFVSNARGASRYRDIRRMTSDGIPVFTYTQFRYYGVNSYWEDFVKLCRKRNILITRKRKYYVGGQSASAYVYRNEH